MKITQSATASNKADRGRPDFLTKRLMIPAEKDNCMDCIYCDRGAYITGKRWPCKNPNIRPDKPHPIDLPCFVRRGSREAALLHGERGGTGGGDHTTG